MTAPKGVQGQVAGIRGMMIMMMTAATEAIMARIDTGQR